MVHDRIHDVKKIAERLKDYGASEGAITSVFSNMTNSGHYEYRIVRGKKRIYVAPIGNQPPNGGPGYYAEKSISEHIGAAAKAAVRRNGNAR